MATIKNVENMSVLSIAGKSVVKLVCRDGATCRIPGSKWANGDTIRSYCERSIQEVWATDAVNFAGIKATLGNGREAVVTKTLGGKEACRFLCEEFSLTLPKQLTTKPVPATTNANPVPATTKPVSVTA